MDVHVLQDLGFGMPELTNMIAAFRWVQQQVYNALLSRGKFAWNLFYTIGGDVPLPHVRNSTCAADLRRLCAAGSPAETRALMYGFTHANLTGFEQDLANFLLVRGEHAWLGTGWLGCDREYPRPALLELDPGVPVDMASCKEGPTGVFTREYSGARVSMDCLTWTPTIEVKN